MGSLPIHVSQYLHLHCTCASPVADLGGISGCHGTPLSAKSTCGRLQLVVAMEIIFAPVCLFTVLTRFSWIVPIKENRSSYSKSSSYC